MKLDGEYKDLPIIYFEDGTDLAKWLSNHHQNSNGVWAKFYKKNSGKKTLTWVEAVPVLLRFGWIDSQAKGLDEVSYLQKFGPRKKNSLWSKINRELAEEMIKNKTISEAGLVQVELAKENGNWERAYSSPSTIEMPEDFKNALEQNEKASNFYYTLNKTNKFAFLFRVVTAKKPETRQKRIKTIIEMLENGEKIH